MTPEQIEDRCAALEGALTDMLEMFEEGVTPNTFYIDAEVEMPDGIVVSTVKICSDYTDTIEAALQILYNSQSERDYEEFE